MKYGNFSTLDCPTGGDGIIQKAYDWLDDELEKISDELNCSCFVHKISNSHDFGPYPSFEVFMPEEFEYCDDEEDKPTIERAEKCLKKLNDLQEKYYKKFAKYL